MILFTAACCVSGRHEDSTLPELSAPVLALVLLTLGRVGG